MQLNTEQKVKATVRPLTAGGNPARIDGPVNFTTTDESVASVEVIDDTTCYVIAVASGTTRIVANFDADLDAGETRMLQFDAEITVTEAEADGASLDFALPEFLILTPVGEPEAVETTVAANDDVEEAETETDAVEVDESNLEREEAEDDIPGSGDEDVEASTAVPDDQPV